MMNNLDDLNFKKLDFNALETLILWAKEEGWNPGPMDAIAFWETDPNGFYGYYLNNELIAGGSIISYQASFGFMGFFIVKPAYRSKGIGRKLWLQRRNKLLARLNKGASIGMDGVVAMQSFYETGGFKIAFRDERHENIGKTFLVHANISVIEKNDLDFILAYDQHCFGFPRPQFMIPWIEKIATISFKYVENSQLKGFAILRKAFLGYKICPLFADNEIIAEELYKACLNAAIGEAVFIDIPMANQAAVALTKKYNTHYVFECARMYYGAPPAIPIEKIFGITTFELG